MSGLRLERLEKRFGATEVIGGIDLVVEPGEFVVFVGPSGCGKSTLLRLIAGLEDPSAGEILIGDRRVTDLPPAERGVAMVFQSYALYPHMTVRGNIAFGLKLARTARETVDQRVARVAAMLEIEALLDRRPRELSGGQRQRVAIARALVREPQVFLLDEPLSNLDAALRVQTRIELARLHRETGATMIYVTHDQVEAMTLADRIVVLNGGRIEQAGAPADVYRRPANLFVAGFLGSPRMNLLEVTVRDGRAHLATGEAVPDAVPVPDGTAILGIRPEAVRIDAEGWLSGRVGLVEELGEARIVHATLADGTTVSCRSAEPDPPRPGAQVGFAAEPAAFHYFDADGRRLGD